MYIYIAKARYKSIVVEKVKVVKETEKQYTLEKQYTPGELKHVNKRSIGKCDSYGYAFGLSKEEAIATLQKEFLKEIEKYEIWIKNIQRTLDLPIEEI